MSLSLIAAPNEMSPAYSPIVFTVSSTNIAECGFRYLCDVYVEGTFVVRLKLRPTGPDGYGEFHINRVLEDFVSYDLFQTILYFQECTQSCKKFYCEFSESYDSSVNCDGVPTLDDVLTTDDYFVWNGAWQPGEFQDATLLASSGVRKFQKFSSSSPTDTGFFLSNWQPLFPGDSTLSELPEYQGLGMPMRIQDSQWACILNATSPGYETLRVSTFASDGTELARYSLNNTYHTFDTADSGKRMLAFPVGPKNLNEVSWNTVTAFETVPQFPVWERVAYYTVQLYNGGSRASQMYRVDVDRSPSKFDGRRLTWMNRYGGFDGMTFAMRDKRTVDVQRSTYSRIAPTTPSTSGWWGGDYETYYFGKERRGSTVSSVNAMDKLALTSGWMNDGLALYLEDLYISPEVYESTCDTPRCFTATSEDDGGFLVLTFNKPHGILDTVNVRIDKCDWSENFSYIEKDVDLSSTDTFTITTASLSYGDVVEGETGTVLIDQFPTALLPVVVTNTSYEQKTSAADRLFNYTVEVASANKRNVQRS